MLLLIEQLINGLTIGSFYALIALGYSMVYGVLKLINFAHGRKIAEGSPRDIYHNPEVIEIYLGLEMRGKGSDYVCDTDR